MSVALVVAFRVPRGFPPAMVLPVAGPALRRTVRASRCCPRAASSPALRPLALASRPRAVHVALACFRPSAGRRRLAVPRRSSCLAGARPPRPPLAAAASPSAVARRASSSAASHRAALALAGGRGRLLLLSCQPWRFLVVERRGSPIRPWRPRHRVPWTEPDALRQRWRARLTPSVPRRPPDAAHLRS